MDARSVQDFSLIEPTNATETVEAQFANAVVATQPDPASATLSITEIRFAIESQFGNQAVPVAITRFRSDFVIQFATLHERDTVALAEILSGHNFSMLLLPWSSQYGATTVDWNTAVTIDISGFPPHAFDPATLGPLLSRHCSIQTYQFIKSKGICRIDAYTLSTRSIPKNGYMGFQYQKVDGVRNVVFPVTMKTYLYSEAPKLEEEPGGLDAPVEKTDSVASWDTAEELGYDREVLEEAYDRQHRANMRLERSGYYGHANCSTFLFLHHFF